MKNHYGPWKNTESPEIFLPSDSWREPLRKLSSREQRTNSISVNHPFVFESAGIRPKFLPYFSSDKNAFDFDHFSDALESLPAQSVVLLQSGAHNPTGCDPSPAQWRELASIFLRRGHLAFVDAAYPGFASGDIDTDLEGVRLFAELEVPLVFVSTYGKCFGLYSERVGVLSIVAPDEEVGRRIESQLRLLARAESGAPPDFGSRLVEAVLSDQELEQKWRQEVRGMADGLKSRRHALRNALEELKTPGDWQHITNQNGMFS